MDNRLLSLGGLFAILWGRRLTLLITAGLVVGVTAGLTLMQSPAYTASATLLIDFQEPVASDPVAAVAPSLQSNYLTTQLGIIASPHVARKVVARYHLAQDPLWQAAFAEAGGSGEIAEFIVGTLLSQVAVVPGQNSRLVAVSYTAGTPQAAAITANAFAAAYQETVLEMSTQPARREAAHLEEALGDLRDKVEQAQQRLTGFQSEKGILLTDERLDVEMERLKELAAERGRLESEAQAAESRLELLDALNGRGQSLAELPEVLSSDLIRLLKGQLSAKEAEFAEISRSLGRNHPRYRSAGAEIATLRAGLEREARTIADGIRNGSAQARARVRGAEEAEAAQKTRVLELKRQRDALPALVRELESAQRNYELGLAQANQYLVQSRLTQTNVMLLNPATPPTAPSSPNLLRNLALAVVLGGVLALLAALLRELLDRRVRSAEDLEGLAEGSLLGTLPRHPG